VNQHFRWQAEPVNPGLSTASGKLNLLFASGTGTPGETGLSISNKGLITFATGQTFPSVTGNETVTGNLTAKELVSTVASGTPPLQVISATQVPNLNASLLGGFGASAFARLAISNEFLANQSILGNGLQTFLGNVGCGPPTWGIQAGNFAANCFNFAIGIDASSSPSMGTYINRPAGGAIHFKEANGPRPDGHIASIGGRWRHDKHACFR